jgi:hypothetical protein
MTITTSAPPPGDNPVPQRQSPPRKLDPEIQRLHLRPANAGNLLAQIEAEASRVYWLKSRHDIRAGRWALVDTWARLVVALGATLSTVSALASDQTLTLVFAIATAIISAVNAAVSPPDVSAANGQAARDYAPPMRRLGELLYALESHRTDERVPEVGHVDGTPYDASYYRDQFTMPTELLDECWADFCQVTDQIDEIERRAPSINQLRQHRGRLDDNRDPQTFWEFRRFARALKYRDKADARLAESSKRRAHRR